jgi:hypothetical protein
MTEQSWSVRGAAIPEAVRWPRKERRSDSDGKGVWLAALAAVGLVGRGLIVGWPRSSHAFLLRRWHQLLKSSAPSDPTGINALFAGISKAVIVAFSCSIVEAPESNECIQLALSGRPLLVPPPQ